MATSAAALLRHGDLVAGDDLFNTLGSDGMPEVHPPIEDVCDPCARLPCGGDLRLQVGDSSGQHFILDLWTKSTAENQRTEVWSPFASCNQLRMITRDGVLQI